MRVTNILLTGASSLGALAQVPDHLNKRAACNRDNLFRCFIDQRYSSQASDFCAELAPFTATVATSIATVTSTVESTITADAAEVTEIHKTTVFTETVPTATTVVTADAAGAVKRQVAANPPKCMTNGVTYPASRITSACSCIGVPASTVSVTHVVSTETITEINTITTTPRATVTSWETVFTATTGGTSTITVLPTQVNRLINGDFETGDLTGWKLSPDSWKGDFYKLGGRQNQWTYLVYDAAGELGILRQVKPIYLEAGSYLIGLHAPPAKFPHNSDYWQKVVRYELVNHATEITISPKFGSSKVMVVAGAIVVPLQVGFDVPEEAEGYYDVALSFLERPPEGQPKSTYCRIDNLYLQKL